MVLVLLWVNNLVTLALWLEMEGKHASSVFASPLFPLNCKLREKYQGEKSWPLVFKLWIKLSWKSKDKALCSGFGSGGTVFDPVILPYSLSESVWGISLCLLLTSCRWQVPSSCSKWNFKVRSPFGYKLLILPLLHVEERALHWEFKKLGLLKWRPGQLTYKYTPRSKTLWVSKAEALQSKEVFILFSGTLRSKLKNESSSPEYGMQFICSTNNGTPTSSHYSLVPESNIFC